MVAKNLGITRGEWTFEIVGDLDTAVLIQGAAGNANFDNAWTNAALSASKTG